MDSGKVLLIINPAAGHRAARRALYPLVQRLCAGGQMATVYATSAPGQARGVAESRGGEFSRVICCGGDGTLNEVLDGLLRAGVRVPVGYVPTGTTNDLAHALRLPTKLSRAIDLAVTGPARDHDVGRFSDGHLFDYVASFGAFVQTAYATPQSLKNALGRAAYFVCGLPEVFALRPRRLTLLADGRRLEGDFYFGSISNSTRIAGLLDLNRAGVAFDDGKLELLLIRRPPTPHALRSLRRGSFDDRFFVFLRASEIEMHFTAPTEWTVDGECAGRMTEIQVRCLPRAVQLVAPAV